MATVAKLKKILEVMEANGLADEYLCAEHDVIYLSDKPEDVPFAEAMIEAGAHYGELGWQIYT